MASGWTQSTTHAHIIHALLRVVLKQQRRVAVDGSERAPSIVAPNTGGGVNIVKRRQTRFVMIDLSGWHSLPGDGRGRFGGRLSLDGRSQFGGRLSLDCRTSRVQLRSATAALGR